MSLRLVLGYLLFWCGSQFSLSAQTPSLDFASTYQRALGHFEQQAWSQALEGFLKLEGDFSVLNIQELGPETLQKMHRTYFCLAQLYRDESDFDQALHFVHRGLDLAIEQYGENTQPLFAYYHYYGDLCYLARKSEKALAYTEKALYSLQKGRPIPMVSFDLDSAQAAVYYSLGQIAYGSGLGEERTMYYYGQSFRLQEDRPDLLPLRLHCLMGQSRFYAERRQFTEAIPPLEQADSLWAAHHEAFLDHPEYHNIERKLLRHRGYYHKRHGDYELAIDYYKQYLRITKEILKTPRAHRYVLTNVEISWICRQLWIANGHLDPRGYSWGDSTVTYIQKALIFSCDDYQPRSVADLPQVENIRKQNFSFHILRTLARYHQMRAFDRGSKADKIAALHLAYDYMEVADQLFDEVLKESINLKGHINRSLLNIATLIYDTNNIFDHFLHQLAPAEADLERAFYYVQKMKALQILLDQLNEEALEKTNLPDAVLVEDQAYLQAFHDLELQLYRAQTQKDSAEVDRLKNIDLFDLQRQYEAFQKGLHQNYPSYHLAKFEFEPTTIKELRACLQAGEVVLEFTGSHSIDYVLAISKEDAILFEDISENSADAREAAAAIKDLNGLLQRSAMNRKRSREQFIEQSHYLYQRYLAPIAPILQGKERIIVIGDGLTNYIPFEALLPTDAVKPFSELDFLVKNHAFSYHYSSTLFVQARKQKRSVEQEGLYTFAPVYDQQGGNLKGGPLIQSEDKNTALRAFDENGTLLPLPESEREVEEIKALFLDKDPIPIATNLRSHATEAALKENLQQPYRYIHIAGHSFADLNNPLFSGIACYPDANNDPNSTMLYMGEIYLLKTQADLITLSSCESGFGQALDSDGLVGLNRAFIISGTPNVVFSLWKVYDKVSAEMMIQFYRGVLDGADYASSLRDAKLRLINDPATASPHYWSPFLMIGR